MVDGALDSLDALQRHLPRRDLPVYLGAAACVVAGVVEWPVAVGIGTLYIAFTWWHSRE
jgi:hypothetical protein